MICEQIKKEKIRVDFNQGLDIRLLREEFMPYLKSIRHKEYHFAWDSLSYEKEVVKGIKLLNKWGIKRSTFYVLCGYDTAEEEDLYRVNLLKSLNQNAYIMKFEKKPYLLPLARWVNQHHIFHGMTYDQFLAREYPKGVPH